jgi:hypothetical protein
VFFCCFFCVSHVGQHGHAVLSCRRTAGFHVDCSISGLSAFLLFFVSLLPFVSLHLDLPFLLGVPNNRTKRPRLGNQSSGYGTWFSKDPLRKSLVAPRERGEEIRGERGASPPLGVWRFTCAAKTWRQYIIKRHIDGNMDLASTGGFSKGIGVSCHPESSVSFLVVSFSFSFSFLFFFFFFCPSAISLIVVQLSEGSKSGSHLMMSRLPIVHLFNFGIKHLGRDGRWLHYITLYIASWGLRACLNVRR